jgi:hypothetical protein
MINSFVNQKRLSELTDSTGLESDVKYKAGAIKIQWCLLTALTLCLTMALSLYTSSMTMSNPIYPPQYNFKNKTTSGGPFQVLKNTVRVGGYKCGGSQNAIVYYPDTNAHKFPLVSFAHGLGSGGNEVAIDYRKLLVGISSWGFIVIATESAPYLYCERIDIDQLRSIEYALQSDERCFRGVNRGAPIGVAGHSMGGQGTIRSAGFKNTNIGAAVALHPVYTNAAKNVKVFAIQIIYHVNIFHGLIGAINVFTGSDILRYRRR